MTSFLTLHFGSLLSHVALHSLSLSLSLSLSPIFFFFFSLLSREIQPKAVHLRLRGSRSDTHDRLASSSSPSVFEKAADSPTNTRHFHCFVSRKQPQTPLNPRWVSSRRRIHEAIEPYLRIDEAPFFFFSTQI
ncbi:hypothetical protein I3842_05G188400 [Carya illinoinensis]|uniref:Uncharacterized protein n=1 Tax=Carya illinoinensis TaxID=32201 RepID=A0A922F125_CARIL|nr:hypothetical protein I3842_05G188400 [Carya illinoinensis]